MGWYDRGAYEYNIPLLPLVAVQAVVMGFLETKRYQGFKKTGQCGLVDTFPFDPINMTSDTMKLKEVKNGRLAMIAMFAFTSQAMVTREGPIDNLVSHVTSPLDHNILSSVLN